MTLQADILSLSPTHYITFNDVVDRGSGTLTDVLGFQNGAVIDANPITKNDTGSLSSGAGRYDAGDSNVINLEENLFQVITYICFANLTRVDAPTVIIKTGGLNNNMAIVGGFGAGHQAMANAGGQFFLNAYSTRTLEVNRSYFFALTWERGNQTGGAGTRCRYYLNGVLEGEAVATNTQSFPTHNGNFGIGNSDNALYFYGGQLPAATNTFDKRVAHWAVFRDVLLSQADLFNLFAKWSIATYIVTNQTELDAVPNEVVNQNIGIEVNVVGSITLDFSTKNFQSNDIDIRYEGTGTLTVQTTQSLNTYATNSGIINIVAPPVTIQIVGFPDGSTVILSQAGVELDTLNNATSPYTYTVGSEGETGTTYQFKVVASGKQDFFVTIDSTETTSAPYLGLDEASEQALNKPSLDFRELMGADTAYQRIAGSDTTLNSQLWELSSWQSEWNTAVVADSPTVGEIAIWIGYLSTTGYDNISFNSSTGEIS